MTGNFFGEGKIRLFDGETGDLRPIEEVIEIIKGRMAKPGGVTPGGLIVEDTPRYLIRVDFSPRTSAHAPSPGIISFWQFPRVPNLDLIEQIYICESPGCKGILPKESKAGSSWVCTACKRAWTPPELGSGMFAFERDMDGWAGLISRFYDRFGGLCEILTMRRRVSVQQATAKVLSGEKNAEMEYLKTHGGTSGTGTEAGYFTMKSLHKDASTGSGIASRIAAFLRGG